MADSKPSGAKPSKAALKALETLKSHALGYPEAWEDHPWGEYAVKVRKKVFVFLSTHTGGLTISVKLPDSAEEVLLLPFTEPTGYGLGKSGWVTAKWAGSKAIPSSLVLPWIEESYRAVAPKTLVKRLDEPG